MNNYDFSKLLSPLRFEQLCRDLLRLKYGQFENFSDGQDGGIDFRYSVSSNNFLIVQCKRYKNKSQLLSNLKKEANKELNSIDFSKYILVVSLDLTPKNKTHIVQLFKGKIKSPNEIITALDLNDLLGQKENNNIELKYPELWMGSINIHQKIFKKGLLDHSQYLQNKIIHTITRFVPNENYFKVLDILDSHNVVIVSGIPGIGKTTLSYAIAAHYVNFNESRVIDISYRKLQEVESFISSQNHTIFLLDDFLGKIKLERNDDFGHLLKFTIERIESSKNSKIVITTRENILNNADRELDSIETINETYRKHLVDLKHYTRKVRAEILFNHLNISDLENEYLLSLINSDITRIIDHKNYSPRLIELSTKNHFLKDLNPETYYQEFLNNLNNPIRIWQKSYDSFPNDLYKVVLLYVFISSDPLPVDKLESTISNLIKKNPKFANISFDEFEFVLKDLEGSFLSFKESYDELIDHHFIVVDFENPSIRDFIDGFIWSKQYWLELIIENALHFEHLFSWELLEAIEGDEILLKALRNKLIKDYHKLENASYGYFDFETEEGTFTSWRGGKYMFYLARIDSIFDLGKDNELGNLVKRYLFKYPFDGTEDLSEKISYIQVASSLISFGLISEKEALNHYVCDMLTDIKELVYLEYLTRDFDPKFLEAWTFDEGYCEEADNLFLMEINHIADYDIIGVFDLLDDYHQVKSIFTLPKTTKRLEELDLDSILKKSAKKLIKSELVQTLDSKKKNQNIYRDIKDREINELFDQLKQRSLTIDKK